MCVNGNDKQKTIENAMVILEPSSVYNFMALIVFGQTARLISSSSLVPAGRQAAGQLQQLIKKRGMEQTDATQQVHRHTHNMGSLHSSDPCMFAVCPIVEDVCQPRTAKRALLRKINGVSAAIKFAPDGVST